MEKFVNVARDSDPVAIVNTRYIVSISPKGDGCEIMLLRANEDTKLLLDISIDTLMGRID